MNSLSIHLIKVLFDIIVIVKRPNLIQMDQNYENEIDAFANIGSTAYVQLEVDTKNTLSI